jgi:hypothetical protein
MPAEPESPEFRYKTPIDQCDVIDRRALRVNRIQSSSSFSPRDRRFSRFLALSGIKLSDVDEVQRAFVRVERAITDLVLFIAIARQVAPMRPLGMFNALEHPYASAASVKNMDKIWDQLDGQRNSWAKGIEQDILCCRTSYLELSWPLR